MAHRLDERTLVAGQIAPQDVAALKGEGVTMIVNNRPDGEDPGQPTSAEIEQAARMAGIDYRHVPISRGIGPADVEAMRAAIHDTGQGQLLAFCRSGTRSALTWAVARNEDGIGRDALGRCLRDAGFDVDPVLHLLRH